MNTELRIPHGVEERPLTVDDVMALSAARAFQDGRKVELIDGRLFQGPQNSTRYTFGQSGAHVTLIDLIGRLNKTGTLRVVSTPSVRISERRLLCPDTAVVRLEALRRAPALLTPRDVVLAVETADTSEPYDDGDKRMLWAEAGLQELWIARMAKNDVRVCREPLANGTWAEEHIARPGEAVSPGFAPDHAIPVNALLGEA